jgi:putative transposase
MVFTGSMPAKKYIIALTCEERKALEKVSRSTRRSVREKTRARILLLSDSHCPREQGGSQTDEEIVARLGCGMLTVYKVRKRAIERGILATIEHKEQEKRKARALDGEQEAHLIALTCSTPPDGQARWSLRLLRERLIEREVVEQVGLETLRRTLKKTNSSRG